LHQLPEGRPLIAFDQWAEAMGLERGGLVPARVHGVVIAEPAALESKAQEIERAGATWVRVETPFTVNPDHLPDERITPALVALPATPWPRSFVPFSHDQADGGLERVIAAIGPLILEAARRGDDHVDGAELVRLTHAAVWNVTDASRQTAWRRAVEAALQALAQGSMRGFATYAAALGRLRFNMVQAGVPAGARALSDLHRAIAAEHRRTQRRAARVPPARIRPPQLRLWSDDDF
jgi:hypothetical protein